LNIYELNIIFLPPLSSIAGIEMLVIENRKWCFR